MKNIPFNVNGMIKVKMNRRGYEIMAERHNRFSGRRTYKYYEKRADKDGYTSFQLWQFMSDYGEYIVFGLDNFFDLEILFVVNEKEVA